MAPTMARSACSSPCSWATSWRSDPVSPDLSLESGPSRSERVARNVFVYMYCLSMLSEVVEARKSATAVALERSFTRMLSVEHVSIAAGTPYTVV